MGKVYSQGIASPKGFNLTAAEPVDQRTIVEYKTDLYFLNNVYKGLKVQVLEEINGEILREFKFIGGDSSSPSNWPEVTGGSGGTVDPSELPLKFTSFVFKRNVGAPATPTGGSYENPVPSGWEDAVPAGTGPLWMSSRIFTQGVVPVEGWTNPILTEDTATTDFEYCNEDDVPPADIVDGLPLVPTENVGTRTYWHNVATSDDDFMAIGNKVGGEYPVDWQVVKISGEQGVKGDIGDDGRAYKESIVFTRTNLANMETASVTGGSFNSPVPTLTKISGNTVAVTWTDGIPLGAEKVWMTKFTFNDVDHTVSSPSNVWTLPGNTTDTSTDDFEFSSSASQPADPSTDPGAWHDVANINDIWMAHRSITNGVFGAWGITKIKGETGDQGQGLNIQGRDSIANILALTSPPVELYDIWIANADDGGAAVPGLTNDAYLYVGAGNGTAGTAWDNIGGITGTDGLSYLQSFVFKRSATLPSTPTGGTFASPIPSPADGWTDSIPAGTDTLWTTSRFFTNPSTATDDWKAPYRATDTVDYDFEYADKQVGDATPQPPDTAPGGTWYNTPTVDSYWMAKGRKVNGVLDPTTWEVLRIKGEKGDTGDAGTPSLLSSVYLRTNDPITMLDVTGGTYASPIPTSGYDGKFWSDGIPAGDGAVWFTQVRFEQTDTGTPTKVWPNPTMIADSTTVEYQFSSSVSKPIGLPVEGSPGANTWHDDAEDVSGTVKWMAIGSIRNGVWPSTWDIVQVLGETGATGSDARTFIPSSRFTRCDDIGISAVTVTGQYLIDDGNGSYAIAGSNPTTDTTVGGFTYEFTDGIPTKTGTFPNNASRVWMIQSVFNSFDDLGALNPKQWGNPTLLADNNSIDYKYHAGADATSPGPKPADPDTVPAEWYDDVDLVPNGAFWLAQKNWSDGVGAQWVIYQIRGENGEDGQGVDLGTPPAQVTGLTHIDQRIGQVTLSWSTPADPDNDLDVYEIKNIQTAAITVTSSNLTQLLGLETDVLYSFQVRAIDEKGNKGAWSTIYEIGDELDYRDFTVTGKFTTNPFCEGVSDTLILRKTKDSTGVKVGDYLLTDTGAVSGVSAAQIDQTSIFADPADLPPLGANYQVGVNISTGQITFVGACDTL